MESKAAPQVRLDPSALGQLACPACLGALRAHADHVLCAACGRIYPVMDGIPVLIAERAQRPDGSVAP